MSKVFYRPELNALRFIAFCLVFCDHISLHFRWWTAVHDMGAFGMPLFFVLSSYLIVTLLLKERQSTGTIDIRSFFVRRALRIWPLYFAVLLGGFLLGIFWKPVKLANSAYVAMFLMVGNFWVARNGWELGWASPLWSLSVEEQFYLAVPSLVRGAAQKKRVLGMLCACIIAASYCALLYLSRMGAIPIIGVWVNSLVQFQFFAAGALIALWHNGRTLRLGRLSRAGLIALALLTWTVAAI